MSAAQGRLLLVDDDPLFCRMLGRALTRRGFEVEVAHGTEPALALARERLHDYAVVDLKLGADSGLALLRQLLALAPELRILVLTGYASIATAVEAIKLGAVHYLAKPADADDVVSALRRAAGDATVPVRERPLSVERLEWEHIQKVLSENAGNVSATARALNMHRRTLQRKLAKRPVQD
jgi:two-component system response regulator RegA